MSKLLTWAASPKTFALTLKIVICGAYLPHQKAGTNACNRKSTTINQNQT
ncbi:hypothetical protein Ptr902_05025 [Pyrenophora tritici-repentis]|nr:hypothetical protein Ptr902_05025 [Pyrenophora tritici-repentis]